MGTSAAPQRRLPTRERFVKWREEMRRANFGNRYTKSGRDTETDSLIGWRTKGNR